jgi:thiosulfate/3-mercaptopyruvate sulfurtransferase
MSAPEYTTLIDTRTVTEHLGDPAFVLIDCRFNLSDPDWGERDYRSAHIPGALYAHLDRDLSGETTGTNGRHPLPDISILAATFGRFGIDNRVQVVAYDQDTGIYASRLWWMLRWLGHDAAAVIDGGFAKWRAEGLPTASGVEIRPARTFVPRPSEGATVDAQEVAALRHNHDWKLIDARAPERFRGEVETIDRAAGHIPGAINHFYQRNLGPAGTFLPRDQLRSALEASVGGALADRVVCYCGSGVTACHNVLAFEHAGLHGAKLYPGSWSEWSSDPARPIATGDERPSPS